MYVIFLILTALLLNHDHLPWVNIDNIKLPKLSYPEHIEQSWLHPSKVDINYTFNEKIQNYIQNYLKAFAPDYAGVILMDASTGDILANNYYSKKDLPNFNFEARFTSASLFKVITAAAALDQSALNPDSLIPHVGRTTSLYRYQLEALNKKRWKHINFYTLEESLAKSINAVFGQIGIYDLGAEKLKQYGQRVGFDRPIPFQQEVEMSRIQMPTSSIETAQLASGFGSFAKLSPLHGALIAASIVNNGVVPKPNIIRNVTWDEQNFYQVPSSLGTFISPETSQKMMEMMGKTISIGTARKGFKNFLKNTPQCGVGGKTGHLTGDDPKGRYDWFIGYLCLKDISPGFPEKIAISILNISEKQWKFKSHWLARSVFDFYIDNFSQIPNQKLTQKPKVKRTFSSIAKSRKYLSQQTRRRGRSGT